MTTISTAITTTSGYWNQQSRDLPICEVDFAMDLIDQLISSQDFSEAVFDEFDLDRPSSLELEQHESAVSSTSGPTDLACVVCGVAAHGYNFDQITCESCKAFFRRNALRNMPQSKCRFSGNCVINAQTRRLCTHCRLKKCFDMGMRKDWIRTDEERQMRELIKWNKEQRKLNKSKIDPIAVTDLPIVIRKKKRLSVVTAKPAKELVPVPRVERVKRMNVFAIHRDLDIEDQIHLNNITNAYKIGADIADCSHINRYTSSSSISDFVNDESKMHQSLIYYFKNVDEFKAFQVNEQILLIKCNLIDIIHLHHIIVQNFRENPRIGPQMSKWIGEDFHYQMSHTREKFDRFTNYPLVLKLALVIFVFSMNLSMPGASDNWHDERDKKKIFQHQNFYVTLLWKYLNYLFKEDEATRSMQIIVMQVLRYQTLMCRFEEVLSGNSAPNVFDPLMRSIFRLT